MQSLQPINCCPILGDLRPIDIAVITINKILYNVDKVNLVHLSSYFKEHMEENIEIPPIHENMDRYIEMFLHTIYRYSEKYGIYPWSGDNSSYGLSSDLICMYYIADFFGFEARKNWYESIILLEFKKRIGPSRLIHLHLERISSIFNLELINFLKTKLSKDNIGKMYLHANFDIPLAVYPLHLLWIWYLKLARYLNMKYD